MTMAIVLQLYHDDTPTDAFYCSIHPCNPAHPLEGPKTLCMVLECMMYMLSADFDDEPNPTCAPT